MWRIRGLVKFLIQERFSHSFSCSRATRSALSCSACTAATISFTTRAGTHRCSLAHRTPLEGTPEDAYRYQRSCGCSTGPILRAFTLQLRVTSWKP